MESGRTKMARTNVNEWSEAIASSGSTLRPMRCEMRYNDAGAHISKDERYRYLLWREWRGTHDPKNWKWVEGAMDGKGDPLGEPRACLFIMLNPSTADGEQDDPTIRRCVSFAARWNFERLEVVNLFAHRATRPADLLALSYKDNLVGPENQLWVERAAETAALIVCAWGVNGGYLDQGETMLGWIGQRPVFALGLTASGHPRHPLYVKGSAELRPYHGLGHHSESTP